jgi:hypothetical protein
MKCSIPDTLSAVPRPPNPGEQPGRLGDQFQRAGEHTAGLKHGARAVGAGRHAEHLAKEVVSPAERDEIRGDEVATHPGRSTRGP